MGVIAITYHALVEYIGLRADNCKGGRWRMSTSILHYEQFAAKLSEDIKSLLGRIERLAVVWDVLKAFIRGKCIAHSSWKKKQGKEEIQQLVKENC